MRSFEFVDGTSAKFWEIDQNGTDVTVRWGRVGTTGQTKVKTFGSVPEAEEHESKLIAEKTRKGYGETAATTAPASPPRTPAPAPAPPAPPAASADEDTFVFPAAWHRYRYVRRGSSEAGRFTLNAKARKVADDLLSRRPGGVTNCLQAPATDPAITRAAEAWRAGDPQSPAVGAAAVAKATTLGNWDVADKLAAFADLWIAERGLRFAAEAAVEMVRLKFDDGLPPGAYQSNRQRFGLRFIRPGENHHGRQPDPVVLIPLRVRAALADASDAEHAEVIEALTAYRSAGAYARAATSVLVPGRSDWVAEDIDAALADDDAWRGLLLLTAAGTGAQVTALAQLVSGYAVAGALTMPATICDGVGADAAPALFHWFDDTHYADGQRRLLSVLAALPSDDVLRGLVQRIDVKHVAPAVLEAAGRFPARALRMLAEGAARPVVATLLRAHVLAHPTVVDRVLPALDAESRQRVLTIREQAEAIVPAPLSAVPPLLVDPPWLRPGQTAKPVVITGLACTDAPTVSWLDGEREAWRQTAYVTYGERGHDWKKLAKRVASGEASWYEPAEFFAQAPEDLARPVLATWRVKETWQAGSWLRVVAARFETDALPAVLDLARRHPAEITQVLLPFAAPEIAVVMADSFARLKKVRETALSWLQRHPTAAARALVPPALDKVGVPRRQAEQALLALHGSGHTDAVRAAAQGYGPAAVEAIQTLLETDPLSVLPVKLPALPGWFVPGLLPPVLLRDGAGALPAEAVGNLVMVLALGRSSAPYAGVDVVRQACEPESLAEFAWGLFQAWQAAGGDSKEGWILDTLGVVGDDETVRRLTPLILAWPGEGGHTRAVTGVQILARIGTDVALMHLHGIAQRAKFKGLKAAAGQKMDEVAAGLGLSADQLADRLVPQFGLDAAGSMVLDYGSRHFTVGFDEQLRPYVADSAGKRLKALPKPGARDDADLAPAAFKQFAALKKDVRTVATDQIRRLERAMVTGRRWSGAEFRQLFVAHPLLWHIVRRLVWAVYDESGKPAGALRVAEDRSFSDVHDDDAPLAEDAIVGVAHPLHLGDSLADWVEVFADYEILQPFPQLSRETFSLTAEEATTARLTRFEGVTVPTGRVIGLERKGWRRETPQDAGVQGRIELDLGPAQQVVIDLDPGIAIGAMDVFPEQKLEMIFVTDGTANRWQRTTDGHIPLGHLDPVAASEMIRDLTELTA
jgi:predicted DNA-binding WGR domain protein